LDDPYVVVAARGAAGEGEEAAVRRDRGLAAAHRPRNGGEPRAVAPDAPQLVLRPEHERVAIRRPRRVVTLDQVDLLRAVRPHQPDDAGRDLEHGPLLLARRTERARAGAAERARGRALEVRVRDPLAVGAPRRLHAVVGAGD